MVIIEVFSGISKRMMLFFSQDLSPFEYLNSCGYIIWVKCIVLKHEHPLGPGLVATICTFDSDILPHL